MSYRIIANCSLVFKSCPSVRPLSCMAWSPHTSAALQVPGLSRDRRSLPRRPLCRHWRAAEASPARPASLVPRTPCAPGGHRLRSCSLLAFPHCTWDQAFLTHGCPSSRAQPCPVKMACLLWVGAAQGTAAPGWQLRRDRLLLVPRTSSAGSVHVQRKPFC